MCLIVFDWQPDANSRVPNSPMLTLAANRDEFYSRETEPMHWWKDAPDMLAGRDLTGGGTWLGVTRDGRFAALTNYRAPSEVRPGAPTRGTLVSNFLSGERVKPLDYLGQVARDGHLYNGFNVIVGDFTRRELAWYGNRADAPPALLDAGIHGLSNSLLNTPWPKLVAQRDALRDLVHAEDRVQPSLDVLIATMRNPHIAADALLPSTGVSIERERVLSAAFIEADGYGTRSTTALRVACVQGQLELQIKELSDDDGSHTIVRPGNFVQDHAFVITR
ncbi:NRDE family protein [Burkholderia sp. Leaf177]|uniref:NRDE family protein n=1 Tax=Burkholderia sp. Leaf177 TaxID=1736287 RepID=UPI0006F74565|nr:NRDE family protein [Burkholderia sp. Leaf177]KQR87147.1 NRDE family protein [Burkholderia sp. Leaf177]